MATRSEFVKYASSLVNQKVLEPTNPYGGQCVAYVSALVRWATNNAKNLAYTNAIDLLSTAKRQGLDVVYFNGSNFNWQEGDIWVTATPYHRFGHTGIFKTAGGQPLTLEQNVDGNADALTNGGYVRQKKRLIYSSKAMAYSDLAEVQTLVGWIKAPVTEDKKTEEVKKTKKETKNNMFGSFAFTVKEGDGEFGKGAVYFYNAQTNTVNVMRSEDEYKHVQNWYKTSTGENLPGHTYSVKGPAYRVLFNALHTDTKYSGNARERAEKALAEIQKTLTSGNQTVEKLKAELSEKLAGLETSSVYLANELKGNDIVSKQYFTATNNINIRKEPSTTSEKLGYLVSGEMVSIVGSAYADGYYWISFYKDNQLVYAVSKKEGGDVYGVLR